MQEERTLGTSGPSHPEAFGPLGHCRPGSSLELHPMQSGALSQLGTYKSRHGEAGIPQSESPQLDRRSSSLHPLVPSSPGETCCERFPPWARPQSHITTWSPRTSCKTKVPRFPGVSAHLPRHSLISGIFCVLCPPVCNARVSVAPSSTSAPPSHIPHAAFFSLSTECLSFLFHLLNLNLIQKYFGSYQPSSQEGHRFIPTHSHNLAKPQTQIQLLS